MALEEGHVAVSGEMVQRALSVDAAGLDCWIFICGYTFNTNPNNNLYPTQSPCNTPTTILQ